MIAERMNKVFRENIEFLFDRFESQDLCAIVELEKLLDILQLAHELLSRDLSIDSFNLMMDEMKESISLVSYSTRLASQIWTEVQTDFLPNFILCNTTHRFVRSSKVSLVPVQKPSVPYAKPNFYCGSQVNLGEFALVKFPFPRTDSVRYFDRVGANKKKSKSCFNGAASKIINLWYPSIIEATILLKPSKAKVPGAFDLGFPIDLAMWRGFCINTAAPLYSEVESMWSLASVN
ncbi:unnamed protein product [Ilex paraguariensis]|uniref:Uncharacterized protein n=1 Tax=Ilex paraguariensis TaxID=185542 RepID=A0ABC8UGF7_9AQUA